MLFSGVKLAIFLQPTKSVTQKVILEYLSNKQIPAAALSVAGIVVYILVLPLGNKKKNGFPFVLCSLIRNFVP